MLGVVLISGLAMIAVVALQMSALVQNTEQDLASANKEVLAAQAADLERALSDPEAAGHIAATRLFRLCGGMVEIDPELGALRPTPPFDPRLAFDVLAEERLRRASTAEDAAAAIAELEPLWRDPASPPAARAWLAARIAWCAHRAGDTHSRSIWAARVDGEDPDSLASAALLARVEAPTAPWNDHERARLRRIAFTGRPESIGALAARLDELGAPPNALRDDARAAALRRALLATVATFVEALVSSDRPVLRRTDSGLLLYWPIASRGALLDPASAVALANELLPHADTAVVVGTTRESDSVPLADGALALSGLPRSRVAYLAGPVGNALLAVALALLCGGGSMFALRAVRRERDAIRTRSEFLATVTHELKTPLAGVRLVAELLGDGHVQDEAERRAWLRRLEGEAARLGMLIENVLDLGRTERGEARHSPELCDLAAVCDDTLALVAALAERDGQVLQVELTRPLHGVVDRPQFQQLLLNLCDNARKYGKPPITIRLRREASEAVLRVRDHGPGVPEGEREMVFERFRRGSAHAHGSVPGVGLGLHLARAIAERHGGTLRADDPTDSGPGVCFTLRLPCAAEQG